MSESFLTFSGFVRRVVEALEAAGVDYMIGGAVASWAWGEPRATQDIDIVVSVPLESIASLSKELEIREMLIPPDILLNALIEDRADAPVSAIHPFSGYKADLYLLRPNDALRQSALSRKKQVDLGPELGEVFLHSPEDLIVYKLWFYSISRQTKHLRDITAIVLSLGEQLDRDYIKTWADEKGLASLWGEMLEQIGDV